MSWNGAKQLFRKAVLKPKRLWGRLQVERLEDRLAPAGLSVTDQQIVSNYGQLPLSFEPNERQIAA